MIAAAVVLAAGQIAPVSLAAQHTAEVIRGRVMGPDGQPVADAQITALSYFGGITPTARTDKNGRFAITYPTSEGDL